MTILEMSIRIFLAIAVGGLIGFERQKSNRPAGFRTHILVCVGAAVISIIQLETIAMTTELIQKNPALANALKADVGRMGAQVITGVGFLGAGTIIREKGLVKGLTTAASLWVVACVGLAIGLGLYYVTGISTLAVFLSLVTLKRVETRFTATVCPFELDLSYEASERKRVRRELERMMNFYSIDVSGAEEFLGEKDDAIHVRYYVEVPRGLDKKQLVHELFGKKGIVEISISEPGPATE